MEQAPQAGQLIFQVSAENFQAGVVEQSRRVPVVLLFWAEQMPVSVNTRKTLETLVNQYQGKFVLALVDVQKDPTLAQHLQVQALPSVRVISDGQIADQFEGPRDEAALRTMLDRLTMSSGDVLRAELAALIAREDYQTALELLKQALAEEPANVTFKIEFADLLIRTGDLEQARALLESIPADAPERERPATRLELVEEAASLPPLDQLRDALADDGENLELRYQCAVQEAVAGSYEPALEHAMLILQRDRGFRDDVGRTTMVKIFNLMGKGSDIATRYRRRMFNFMH